MPPKQIVVSRDMNVKYLNDSFQKNKEIIGNLSSLLNFSNFPEFENVQNINNIFIALIIPSIPCEFT